MKKTALSLIRTHEGLRLRAYRCPAGVLTIGYGHTGPDVTPGLVITAARADELLQSDLDCLIGGLTRLDPPSLTPGQGGALLSFAFNVGLGALARSTLWRKVRANPSDSSIQAEFMRWVYARGRRLPGLVARRRAEAEAYIS